MAEVPSKLANLVRERVRRDLDPSYLTVYLKSGIAVALGGVLSLLVCGQFGLSLSHLAQHFQNQLHTHVHHAGSALICGAVFAISSPFILRCLCSALQFRAILKKGLHAPLVWFTATGSFLAQHGEAGGELVTVILWVVAAWGTFEVLSRAILRVNVGARLV